MVYGEKPVSGDHEMCIRDRGGTWKACLYLRRGRRFEGKEMLLKSPVMGFGWGR